MDFISVPFGYVLRFCYSLTNNYALALIFFTLLIKLIFLFVNIKQQRSTQDQARVKPKIRAIQKRYEGRTDANARIEMSNDLMAMYKEEKVSAATGCLPLLIQIPIVLILYQIVTRPLTFLCRASEEVINGLKNTIFTLIGQPDTLSVGSDVAKLYTSAAGDVSKFSVSELQIASVIKNNSAHFGDFLSSYTLPDFTIFGGAIDLSATPTIGLSLIALIPILVGVFQLLSALVIRKFGAPIDTSSPEAAQAAKTMNYMNIIMPLMTVWFAFNVPAILGVYWIYQSIFGAIIQIVLSKIFPVKTYTEEEMLAIEAEYNKDYVRPVITASAKRSLHFIDEDDYEDENSDAEEDLDEENETSDSLQDIPPVDTDMPKRRLYDKNGNKIRSLHFIDEDDDEVDTIEPTEYVDEDDENKDQ